MIHQQIKLPTNRSSIKKGHLYANKFHFIFFFKILFKFKNFSPPMRKTNNLAISNLSELVSVKQIADAFSKYEHKM
jgi:hypothetical protein